MIGAHAQMVGHGEIDHARMSERHEGEVGEVGRVVEPARHKRILLYVAEHVPVSVGQRLLRIWISVISLESKHLAVRIDQNYIYIYI